MKKFSLFIAILCLFGLLLSLTVAQDTYYVSTRSARVRAEPNTTSAVVANLRRNTAITVLEVVDGTRVSRSTKWYRIEVDGEPGYIHSSLVTSTPPRGAGGSSGSGGSSSGGTSQNLQSTPAPDAPPIAPPAPPQGASCGGATTCGQMTSCDQAYACLAAGDSGLDRDHDGVPCESICPGG